MRRYGWIQTIPRRSMRAAKHISSTVGLRSKTDLNRKMLQKRGWLAPKLILPPQSIEMQATRQRDYTAAISDYTRLTRVNAKLGTIRLADVFCLRGTTWIGQKQYDKAVA